MDEAEYCNTIGMMYQGKMVALASPETLKNNLPGVLVQLECDRPGDVVKLVSGQDGVINTTIHGALVHLTLKDTSVETLVKETLAHARINIKTWEIIQPSLEDVFLTMVSEQLSTTKTPAMEEKRRKA
jgi:ABC-2 type transport system ATP-binding protein